MSKYVSMANQQGYVDCRMLQLELEFYQLDQLQINSLSSACLSEILKILEGDVYCDWSWDGGWQLREQCHIKKEDLLSNIHNAIGNYQWGCTGDIISETIWDARSFRQYQKKLNAQLCLKNYSCIPIDYKACFKELFKKNAGQLEIKSAFLEMFNIPGKCPKYRWENHDFMISFCSNSYENFDWFYGKFVFSIALPCVSSCAIEFAEQLANIARKASEAVTNVSGRVTLSPIYPIGFCSGHMRYFGDLSNTTIQPPTGYEPIEWYPYYYLCGAEWFNLLSPLQKQHLPQLNSISTRYPNVAIEALSSGGYIVRCKRNILQTDIAELKEIKSILYSTLYPGYSEILLEHLWDPDAYSFSTKPRIQWEYVPMYEDEISVLTHRVRFQHKLSANYLYTSG